VVNTASLGIGVLLSVTEGRSNSGWSPSSAETLEAERRVRAAGVGSVGPGDDGFELERGFDPGRGLECDVDPAAALGDAVVLEPGDPAVSADAIAGSAVIAAPTPSATASAPTRPMWMAAPASITRSEVNLNPRILQLTRSGLDICWNVVQCMNFTKQRLSAVCSSTCTAQTDNPRKPRVIPGNRELGCPVQVNP